MENKKEAFQMSNIKKAIFDHAIYVVLVILLVLFVILEPRFLSLQNFQNLLAQSSTKIIIAIGAGMILVVQGVDLSSGRAV